MKLYHGTNIEFSQIDFSKSKSGKDFGLGFYLTPEKEIAHRQAERKYEQFETGDIIVQEYEFDEKNVENLSVLRFDSYTLEWARFVLLNRKNRTKIQQHHYDIVIGPIADDAIGFQIRRLEDGIITEEQFLEEIKYHTVTMQYLFCSGKSLLILHRL